MAVKTTELQKQVGTPTDQHKAGIDNRVYPQTHFRFTIQALTSHVSRFE